MTLVKCPNGHYYDSSRFGNNCPHCGMSGAASIGADQTTVPLNIPDAPQPANEVTEPLTVSQPVVSQPANVTAPTVSDDDRTLPVTADMLDGMVEKPAPVVGWLVCTDGVNKGTDYRLHQGRNFVGRSPEMDVCILGDNTVSRSSACDRSVRPRSNVYLRSRQLEGTVLCERQAGAEPGRTQDYGSVEHW